MHEDLIYDFGVNNGRDTEFYLAKGFRVVGVEANPNLYRNLKTQFSGHVATGQLILLNVGVWTEPSVLKFYVNLDNDHWSSFDPVYGCRNGSRYEVMEVRCLTASELLRRFGAPYYMKIDVEGADKHILSDIKSATELPAFMSVEEFGVECIDLLHGLGYAYFKIVPQRDKLEMVPPNPSLEGAYVARIFDGTDSGLFGRELSGEWMLYEDARRYFVTHIRNEQHDYLGPENEWHDVHACR
jgi:FkbM family methyltransferase